MLGMRKYTQEYIDACRSRVDLDLSAYRSLVAAAKPASDKALLNGAFEATFFNNMVLILDYLFVHRLATTDGKDGNPLNEVRVMCDSMLNNNNIMTSSAVSRSYPISGPQAPMSVRREALSGGRRTCYGI